jgi:hypothetical protein
LAAGAGAGAGAAAGAGAITPSQPAAAVAGVQLLVRQHKPLPFFHASPEALRQLLMSCALATEANPRVATINANLLSFFMVFLKGT